MQIPEGAGTRVCLVYPSASLPKPPCLRAGGTNILPGALKFDLNVWGNRSLA